MEYFKVVVAGGRDFNNYNFLKDRLDFLFKNIEKEKIIIVSGGARGADRLGEQYAQEHNLSWVTYAANWDKFGRSAGFIRNDLMAQESSHCICFWDGISKGTGHMINLAKKHELELKVYKYEMISV